MKGLSMRLYCLITTACTFQVTGCFFMLRSCVFLTTFAILALDLLLQ